MMSISRGTPETSHGTNITSRVWIRVRNICGICADLRRQSAQMQIFIGFELLLRDFYLILSQSEGIDPKSWFKLCGCRKGVNCEVRRKVIISFQQNPRLSEEDRAKRYGISKSASRNIRVKAGYKSYRLNTDKKF